MSIGYCEGFCGLVSHHLVDECRKHPAIHEHNDVPLGAEADVRHVVREREAGIASSDNGRGREPALPPQRGRPAGGGA